MYKVTGALVSTGMTPVAYPGIIQIQRYRHTGHCTEGHILWEVGVTNMAGETVCVWGGGGTGRDLPLRARLIPFPGWDPGDVLQDNP